MAQDDDVRLFVAPLSSGELREAEFRFRDNDRRVLLELLGSQQGDHHERNIAEFLSVVEFKIAKFKALRDLAKEKTRDSKIRDMTKKVGAHALSLKNALEAVNTPETRFLIELCLQATMLPFEGQTINQREVTEQATLKMLEETSAKRKAAQDFFEELIQNLNTLHNATLLTETIIFDTESGRPTEHARLGLATSVAWSLQEILKIEPTTTQEVPGIVREGLFTSVLRVVLNAAGIYIEDLHRLAGDAVRALKEIRQAEQK